MKKRLITIFLACMLLASGPAMADESGTETGTDPVTEGKATEAPSEPETEPQIINMSIDDMDPRLYVGKWINTGYGVHLYVPNDWTQLPISAEDSAKRLLFQASDAEQNYSVALSGTDASGLDIDQLYQTLSDTQDYHNVNYANVNGISAVSYQLMTKEYVLSGLAYLDATGNVYFLVVGPVNDETFASKAMNILESLCRID